LEPDRHVDGAVALVEDLGKAAEDRRHLCRILGPENGPLIGLRKTGAEAGLQSAGLDESERPTTTIATPVDALCWRSATSAAVHSAGLPQSLMLLASATTARRESAGAWLAVKSINSLIAACNGDAPPSKLASASIVGKYERPSVVKAGSTVGYSVTGWVGSSADCPVWESSAANAARTTRSSRFQLRLQVLGGQQSPIGRVRHGNARALVQQQRNRQGFSCGSGVYPVLRQCRTRHRAHRDPRTEAR
jgi:hypothetical protein